MKTLNLVAVIFSVMLTLITSAHADVAVKANAHNHNFMAKRPYQQAILKSEPKADPQWEGATLVEDELKNDTGSKNRNTMRLNMLSKRAY